MNAKELASLSGLSERTIRNMIKRGDLKADKKGREFEIDEKQAWKIIFIRRFKYDMYKMKAQVENMLLPLRIEKIEIFENILEKFKEISNIEDINEKIKVFESKKNIEELKRYIQLMENINVAEKTLEPTFKNLDKNAENMAEKILNGEEVDLNGVISN